MAVSRKLTPLMVDRADAVVLVTEWPQYRGLDFAEIAAAIRDRDVSATEVMSAVVERTAQNPAINAIVEGRFEALALDHALPALDDPALGIEQRYRISFWDAMIVAAADRAGVETLSSEDFNHGQKFGRVQVVNPFT